MLRLHQPSLIAITSKQITEPKGFTNCGKLQPANSRFYFKGVRGENAVIGFVDNWNVGAFGGSAQIVSCMSVWLPSARALVRIVEMGRKVSVLAAI